MSEARMTWVEGTASRGGNPGSRLGLERRMAGAAGLEPVTSAVTGQRSNQLSYAPAGELRLWKNQGRKSRMKNVKRVGLMSNREITEGDGHGPVTIDQ